MRERRLHPEVHNAANLCTMLTPKLKRKSTIPIYKNLKYIQNRNVETQIILIQPLNNELANTWHTESALPIGIQTAGN